MTRAQAAATLRELADGDSSEYGAALLVAIRALEPPARKPKLSPNLAAFLKIGFPAGVAADPRFRWPDEAGIPPEVRAQFEYGRPAAARRYTGPTLDKAILAAARA